MDQTDQPDQFHWELHHSLENLQQIWMMVVCHRLVQNCSTEEAQHCSGLDGMFRCDFVGQVQSGTSADTQDTWWQHVTGDTAYDYSASLLF